MQKPTIKIEEPTYEALPDGLIAPNLQVFLHYLIDQVIEQNREIAALQAELNNQDTIN